jgi:hypothetical protein
LSIDEVIAGATEDHENGRAWMAEHGHEHSLGEDLAIWEQGRLAATILGRVDGTCVECCEQFTPWECPDRITYTVATGTHELYRCSRLGSTLERVIADELDDVRRGLAWCAERGQEPPAEDRTIWEEGWLVAAIIHRTEGPLVVRFDGATATKGGGL